MIKEHRDIVIKNMKEFLREHFEAKIQVRITANGKYSASVDSAFVQTRVNQALGIGWVPFKTYDLLHGAFDTPEQAMLELAMTVQGNEMHWEHDPTPIRIPSFLPDLSAYSEIN